MSLNGLDQVDIIEAHEAAAAEPGGWFLLKYASRDEVELLGRGSGGVVEVRSAIAQHDDQSPLYGFLRYRRRNVIVKYLPEDCSRLIRARVAVHFNAVCERFSPYDTIFDIATASELRDTKLSAACSLHAASGSTSSSTSSRRRRLGEIAEEDEEEHPHQQASRRQSAQDNTNAQRPSTPLEKSLPPDPPLLPSDLASSPEPSILSTTTTATSAPPNIATPGDGPTSPARSIEPDSYNYSPYPAAKPKVKLGPRPSLDATIRPQTAGNFKPVSSIPAGIKLFGKGAKKGKGKDKEKHKNRDKEKDQDRGGHAPSLSQDGSSAPTQAIALPSRLPSEGNATADRLLASPIPAPAPARPSISPEKARLMKAMQLREKKRTIAALKEQQDAITATTATTTTAASAGPADETTRADPTEEAVNEKAQDEIDAAEGEEEEGEEEEEEDDDDDEEEDDEEEFLEAVEEVGEPRTNPTGALQEAEAQETKAAATMTARAIPDAAVPAHLDDHSEITQTESRADSPVIVSSETDHSTLASSLSELTDETVQGKGGHHGGTADPKTEEEDKPTIVDVVEIETPSEPRSSAEMASQRAAALDRPELDHDDAEGLDVPKLMVPKSKFSTQDLASASKAFSSSPSTVSSLRFEAEPRPAGSQAWDDEDDVDGAETRHPSVSQARAGDMMGNAKGSDDSDLADYAGSSMQEAVPHAASIAPALVPENSDGTARASVPETMKSASQQSRGGNLAAAAENTSQLARSGSSGAAFLHKVNQQQQQSANTVSVKPIVGSSISQRIKALEMLSASSGDQGRPTSRERPSATFHAVQKREGASVADRAKSLKNAPAPAPPLGPSPDLRQTARKRSPSLTNSLSRFDSTRSRSEASQAMSKPARDARPQESRDEHGSANQPKQMHATADEHVAGSEGYSRSSGSSDRDAKNGKRSSMTKVEDLFRKHRKSTTGSADTQQDPSSAGSPGRPPSSSQQGQGSGPRRSMSSRRSSIGKDFDPSSPPDDDKGDRTMSRAGRFMRRLSNFPSALGKGSATLASAPVAEEIPVNANRRSLTINVGPPAAPAAPVVAKPSTSSGPVTSTAAVSDMGDVNVQFPDNLLWKRRNLTLDSQGFLVLSASSQNGKVAVGTKRYHLSEFRQPYTPDVEVQELPNSVCLDFIEGGGLQIACEDRLGQINVLSVLRDAHNGHSTFGQ